MFAHKQMVLDGNALAAKWSFLLKSAKDQGDTFDLRGFLSQTLEIQLPVSGRM